MEHTKRQAIQAVELVNAPFAAFPWHDRAAYGAWLAQIYHYVRHATRLLAFAAARCPLDKEAMHKSFLKGIREEAGHEDLAAKDLRHLGFRLEDFPELPETASYRQTLYYAIDHDGPAALIGWFLPLEGLAAVKLKDAVPRVVELYGPQGASFLKVHCQADVGHFDDGLKMLEGLSPAELAVVERALVLSAELYGRMVERVKRASVHHKAAS